MGLGERRPPVQELLQADLRRFLQGLFTAVLLRAVPRRDLPLVLSLLDRLFPAS